MEENNEQLKNIKKVLSVMSKCNTLELTTAIALLPDIMQLDGISVIIAAAGRVAAERLPDRIEQFGDSIMNAARQCLKQMKEEEQQ